MRTNAVKSNYFNSPIVIAILAVVIACAVGTVVATAGASSQVALLGVSAAILAAFGLVCVFIYDVPLAQMARIAFVASFFFKSDVMVMKLDELEDPSGLNIWLTFVCAVILWLYDRFDDDREPRAAAAAVFPLGFSGVLAGLTLCAALAAFYGVNGKLGWFSFLSYLTSVFVCWTAASHFGRRDRIRELVIGIALGIGFTGVTALSQFLVNFPKVAALGTGTEEELLWTQAELFSRVSGFLRTPTEMGWVISALVPIGAAVLFSKAPGFTNFQKIVIAGASLLGVAAIVLSLARGSWIALVAATVLVIALAWMNWERDDRRRYFAAVAGFLVLCAIALTPFMGRIYERLTTDDGDSAAIRIPLMKVARNTIEDNPLVGVGLSGYRTAMYRYDDTSEHVTQIFPGTVHNSFAHVTAEIGLPGGILFALLLVVAVLECWRSMASHDRLLFALGLGAFAAIVAYVISAVKEPGGLGSARPPVRTMFMLLGFVMAVSAIRRRTVSGF